MRSALQYLLPFLVVGLMLVVAVMAFVLHRRTKTGDPAALQRTLLDGLVLASLVGILVITLVASSPRLGERPVNLIPFQSISQLLSRSVDATIPIRNIVLNVLLFAPFGFFFALRQRGPSFMGRTALAGLGLATAVETVQFAVLPGRVVDVDDVLLNVLGTVCGAGVLLAVTRFRTRTPA